MRPINKIIIHCAATPEGMNVDAKLIDKWHKKRGFKKIGYHYFIKLDGTIERGRPIEEMGSHCSGHNYDSIGICYAGGLDKNKQPKDTRTSQQKQSFEYWIKALVDTYPSIKEIKGHRDYSPDRNKDGEISPDEWIKVCPCFDAEKEYKHLLS